MSRQTSFQRRRRPPSTSSINRRTQTPSRAPVTTTPTAPSLRRSTRNSRNVTAAVEPSAVFSSDEPAETASAARLQHTRQPTPQRSARSRKKARTTRFADENHEDEYDDQDTEDESSGVDDRPRRARRSSKSSRQATSIYGADRRKRATFSVDDNDETSNNNVPPVLYCTPIPPTSSSAFAYIPPPSFRAHSSSRSRRRFRSSERSPTPSPARRRRRRRRTRSRSKSPYVVHPSSSSSSSHHKQRRRRSRIGRMCRMLLTMLIGYFLLVHMVHYAARFMKTTIFPTSSDSTQPLLLTSETLPNNCHHVTSLWLLQPLLRTPVFSRSNSATVLQTIDFTLHNDSAKLDQLKTAMFQHQQFLIGLLQGFEEFPFFTGTASSTSFTVTKNIRISPSEQNERQQWRIGHYRQVVRDLRARLVDIETTIAMLRAQIRELSGTALNTDGTSVEVSTSNDEENESEPASSATFGDVPSASLSSTPSFKTSVGDVVIHTSDGTVGSGQPDGMFAYKNTHYDTQTTNLFSMSDECTKLGLLLDMLSKSVMLDTYVDILSDIMLELDMFREVPATTRRDFASILEGGRVLSTYETENLKCSEEMTSTSGHDLELPTPSTSEAEQHDDAAVRQRSKHAAPIISRFFQSLADLFQPPSRRRARRRLGTAISDENDNSDEEDEGSTSSALTVAIKCPELVISPGLLPGQCWAFTKFPGKILIRLASPLFIKAFQLEHLEASLHDTYIDSAPRNVTVYGVSKDLNEQVSLGRFVYNAYALHARQRFNLPAPTVFAWAYVMLQINSNWGNPYFTCVYRLRVFGEPVAQP